MQLPSIYAGVFVCVVQSCYTRLLLSFHYVTLVQLRCMRVGLLF
jgi:hypothetical protein